MADPEQGASLLATNRKVSNMSSLNVGPPDDGRLDLHQMAREGHVTSGLEDLLLNIPNLDLLDNKDNSALHYAARYSHLEIAQILLRAGAEVNMIGSDSMTPLHYACRYGRNETERSTSGRTEIENYPGLQVVQALLDGGAIINQPDNYDLQPLHHAAMRGNFKVVELLTQQKNIDINCQDTQRSTPLHIAATYGNTTVARVLLSAGADCQVLDYQEQNVLHRAAREGIIEVLEAVIDSLSDDEIALKTMMKQKDDEQNTPLLMAVQAGNSEAVKLFMERCGSEKYVNQANVQKECPVHFASRSGDLETVKILVEYGADLSSRNLDHETALHLAAEHARKEEEEEVELVKFLVERGANVGLTDRHGNTAIMVAACQGHVNIVRYLQNQGASLSQVDRSDKNIIHLCASFNRTDVIKELLSDNELAFDFVNTNDQYDNTPLHEACREGHVDMVKSLLDLGADIDNKNEDEQTPFHLAAKYGHTEVVECMLAKDQSAIHDRDEDDNTGLHLASTAMMSHTVELLLNNGASVYDKNDMGWTALDCAAAVGSYRCAVLLLENGSPLDPQDRKKTTPLHLTAIHGHPRLTALLLDRGADVSIENDEGKNVMELAISHRKRTVVECLLNNKQWKKSLQTSNVVTDPESEEIIPNTPIRMLIRHYPDLASKVFTKCISQGDKKCEMDYSLLEDTFSLRMTEQDGQPKYVTQSPDVFEPYCSNGRVVKNNHCLMLMNKNELLRHPLCLSLIRHKWKTFGRFVFFFQLTLYILFLISVTTYVLLKLSVGSYPGNLKDDPSNNSRKDLENGTLATVIARFCVLVFAAMGLFIEIAEVIRMRINYFSLSNILDWGIYILSIVFVMDFNMKYETHACYGSDKCWQWPVGSFLLTCTWLNLLAYFRHLPSLGIFILMFTHIFKTMTRFLIVGLVFIIAFGLGFHVLLVNQSAFEYPIWSMAKTYVMMIGEFEFEGIFTENVGTSDSVDLNNLLPFPEYSIIVFIVFVFVMSIIIMNLLVGLAVDDIKQIQDSAEIQKLSLQVNLVLDLERFFPNVQFCLRQSFLERYSRQTKTILTPKKSYFRGDDVLLNASIWERILEETSDDSNGREGNLENVADRQRELRDVVKGVGSQLDILAEEVVELKAMVGRMEKRGSQWGKVKYQGDKKNQEFTQF